METWRYREPEIGLSGWMRKSHNRTEARTPIKVIALSDGTLSAIILVDGRYEKRVFTAVLDCGREFKTRRGDWIPETDPRVRAWLVKAVRDIRAGGKKACKSDDLLTRADTLRDLEWIMLRNRWTVP